MSDPRHHKLEFDQVRSSNMKMTNGHDPVTKRGNTVQPQGGQGDISSKIKLQPKDLKAMGLAAGGKLSEFSTAEA